MLSVNGRILSYDHAVTRLCYLNLGIVKKGNAFLNYRGKLQLHIITLFNLIFS